MPSPLRNATDAELDAVLAAWTLAGAEVQGAHDAVIAAELAEVRRLCEREARAARERNPIVWNNHHANRED